MHEFNELLEFLEEFGWRLFGRWKCWAVFIKPNNPNERPLPVYVNPDFTIPPEEWDRVVELLS
jgi:hypothetical protein